VHVSRVTITRSRSVENVGGSDTRMGLNGGGGDGGTAEGRGGTTSFSSELGTDLIFSEGRSEGDRGTGFGA